MLDIFVNKKVYLNMFWLIKKNYGGRIIDNLQIDNRQIDNPNLQIDNRKIDNLNFFFKHIF